MLNSKGQRELAYLVRVSNIEPIEGSDNCECAIVNGWRVMVNKKENIQPNDIVVYFEIDSKVDISRPEFKFLESKKGKIKTQRYTFGGKGNFISQGLIMPISSWVDIGGKIPTWLSIINDLIASGVDVTEEDCRFLTKELNVTYSVAEDNYRKSSIDKYKAMAKRHSKIANTVWWHWLYKRIWGRKILFLIFGHKSRDKCEWPTGKFEGVSKTDQERVENMPWVLNDKTKFVRTQKCDGSSATYILKRKPFGRFEFYVCSRNVRMLKPNQESYYGDHNYYWETALKYDIENKMKRWLKLNPEASFVCWQGEICAPAIQGNPHGLSETHFFCFHWTDSINGRLDIRSAKSLWRAFNMEIVPIDDELYLMPDDFEELKQSADGFYDASVCEGNANHRREGYVYYSTENPRFSFKNVSREYLLNK